MIDRTLELAAAAAAAIDRDPRFQAAHDPELGCVVFRYRPADPRADADAINDAIRRRLFDAGRAVIGHTRVQGRKCLKLTFLNPRTERSDVSRLLELIAEEGRALEASEADPDTPSVTRGPPGSLLESRL
jgi:L-2,4-diaminobutyrate decarboxylase